MCKRHRHFLPSARSKPGKPLRTNRSHSPQKWTLDDFLGSMISYFGAGVRRGCVPKHMLPTCFRPALSQAVLPKRDVGDATFDTSQGRHFITPLTLPGNRGRSLNSKSLYTSLLVENSQSSLGYPSVAVEEPYKSPKPRGIQGDTSISLSGRHAHPAPPPRKNTGAIISRGSQKRFGAPSPVILRIFPVAPCGPRKVSQWSLATA